MLENVLRETLDALTREKISRQEIEVLREVAARHRDESLSLDPVTVELVGVILDARFDIGNQRQSLHREMSLEIATVLYEAPASRERLERLWNQLLEPMP